MYINPIKFCGRMQGRMQGTAKYHDSGMAWLPFQKWKALSTNP